MSPQEEELLRQAAAALKHRRGRAAGAGRAPGRRAQRLERELTEARRAAGAAAAAAAAAPAAKEIGGVKFAGRVVDNVPGKELKSLADDLKQRIGSGVVAVDRPRRRQGVDRRRRHRRSDAALQRGRSGAASAPRRSAARAAAAVPTWRRPAAPTQAAPTPRSQRSKRRSQGWRRQRNRYTSITLSRLRERVG